MGTWIGAPWNGLAGLKQLWFTASHGQHKGAVLAAKSFLRLAPVAFHTEESFAERYPILEQSVADLDTGPCSLFSLRPGMPQTTELGVDVAGLFKVLRECRDHDPTATNMLNPSVQKEMSKLAWCSMRLGKENLASLTNSLDEALFAVRGECDQLRLASGSIRTLCCALSQIANEMIGKPKSNTMGKWFDLRPLGSKDLQYFKGMRLIWTRLRGECFMLQAGGIAVVTTTSCARNWVRNMELAGGMDTFPYLFSWMSSRIVMIEVVDAFEDYLREAYSCDMTMCLVALARKWHIVWYAAFSAIGPEAVLKKGLDRGPVGYDYKNGRFIIGSLQKEIDWARDLRERVGTQCSETILKMKYHSLPSLPQDMTLLYLKESVASPVIPGNTFQEEVTAAAGGKVLMIADSMGSDLLRSPTYESEAKKRASREMRFRAWRQAKVPDHEDCFGLQYNGSAEDFYKNGYTDEDARRAHKRGQVIIRAILEGYDYHNFIGDKKPRATANEDPESTFGKFAKAAGVGGPATMLEVNPERYGATDDIHVTSDAFGGQPPLHSSRTLWVSIRRAVESLSEEDVMAVVICNAPMIAQVGLATYCWVPNTSRMVAQTENLETKLTGGDRNTTLFCVRHGPDIVEPTGHTVRWDELLPLAEATASDCTDRIVEQLELPEAERDQSVIDHNEQMTATPTFPAVKSEQKDIPGRPTYSTAYFCRTICRAFTAACAVFAMDITWTKGSYDVVAREGLYNAAMRMDSLSWATNIDLKEWSPSFHMSFHLMRISVVLTMLDSPIKKLTLQAWLRNRVQYFRSLGKSLYKTGTSVVGFPMGWTPAADSIIHGAWLTWEIIGLWTDALDTLAGKLPAKMASDAAEALLREAVILACQIDDASVLSSWRESACRSMVNSDERLGPGSPRPPMDWDEAKLGPKFGIAWPAGWTDRRIQAAILAAGAIIDKRVESTYKPHGAVVNTTKQTSGKALFLYLNDLINYGVLVKKSGATAVAAAGRVAGYAANELDRARMAFSAYRSAVECGFFDFAVAQVCMFAAFQGAMASFATHVDQNVFRTEESRVLNMPPVMKSFCKYGTFPTEREALVATLLMLRPSEYGGVGIAQPCAFIYGGNNSMEDFLTFLAETRSCAMVSGAAFNTIAAATERVMRIMLHLVEPQATAEGILRGKCNMYRKASYQPKSCGLRLKLVREVLEALPPHPAWALLLDGSSAHMLEKALIDTVVPLVEEKGQTVPARPLWMLLAIARDLDSGLTFRATESERLVNDTEVLRDNRYISDEILRTNAIIGSELAELMSLPDELLPAAMTVDELLTCFLRREEDTGITDTFTCSFLLGTSPSPNAAGRGVFQVVASMRDLAVGIKGLPEQIDNLVTHAGRLVIKKPEKVRFDMSASPWTMQSNHVCQVVALWKESAIVEMLAHKILSLIRRGASEALIAKAKTCDVPMRQLSAFDDYRLTVIPEASPISSAVGVKFPDERAIRDGHARYDIGTLLASCISAGRLGLCMGKITGLYYGICFNVQIRSELYSCIDQRMPSVSCEAAEELARVLDLLPDTLGHVELDKEAQAAGDAVLAKHKRLLTLAGWEQAQADSLSSEIGELQPPVRINPDYDPRGSPQAAWTEQRKHGTAWVKTSLFGLPAAASACPWKILKGRFGEELLKGRHSERKYTPGATDSKRRKSDSRIITRRSSDEPEHWQAPGAEENDNDFIYNEDAAVELDEDEAYTKGSRSEVRAMKKMEELNSGIVALMRAQHYIASTGSSVVRNWLTTGQVLWSAVLLTASKDIHVHAHARSLGLPKTFRAGFVESIYDKEGAGKPVPPLGWAMFEELFDSADTPDVTAMDFSSGTRSDGDERELSCDPTVMEVAVFSICSGLAKGSMDSMAAVVYGFNEDIAPEECYNYAYLLRLCLADRMGMASGGADVQALGGLLDEHIKAGRNADEAARPLPSFIVGQHSSASDEALGPLMTVKDKAGDEWIIKVPKELKGLAAKLPRLPTQVDCMRAKAVVEYVQKHADKLAAGAEEFE